MINTKFLIYKKKHFLKKIRICISSVLKKPKDLISFSEFKFKISYFSLFVIKSEVIKSGLKKSQKVAKKSQSCKVALVFCNLFSVITVITVIIIIIIFSYYL